MLLLKFCPLSGQRYQILGACFFLLSAMATSFKVRTFLGYFDVSLDWDRVCLSFWLVTKRHKYTNCLKEYKKKNNIIFHNMKNDGQRLQANDKGHFLTQLDFCIFNDCDLLMATTWLRRCRRHKTQSPTIKMTHKK